MTNHLWRWRSSGMSVSCVRCLRNHFAWVAYEVYTHAYAKKLLKYLGRTDAKCMICGKAGHG